MLAQATATLEGTTRHHHQRWPLFALAGLLLTVWVLNVSRAGTRIEGCPDICSQAGAAPRREGSLRVMSLNVLHGFPRFEHLAQRLDLVAAEILRQDADLVCLNEVPWTPGLGNAARLLAERTGLNYLYLRANGNRQAILFEEGEAILSRYPLRDPHLVELEPRAGLFEHRVALYATAVTPWGDLGVVVTHLTAADPAANRQQVAWLQAFVASQGTAPAVVAGDFNATEDTAHIQDLSRAWVDTYRAANPADPGFTCCIDDLTSQDESLRKRIDYLFVVPGLADSLQVVSSRRVLDSPIQVPAGWLWVSDHAGLLVEIQN